MIKVGKLKSHNFFLNLLFSLINLIVGIVFGTVNMFISLVKWFLNLFIKEYKHENIYLIFTNLISIIFGVKSFLGLRKGELVTWIGSIPSFIHIIILSISSILLILTICDYIFKIFKDKFWLKRSLSYISTLILGAYVFDVTILDFITRWNSVTRPVDTTSTYDTMIYFMKSYEINFQDGILTTIKLALLGTIFGLILSLGMVALRMLTVSPRDNVFVAFLKKIGSTFAKIYVTVIRGTPMVVQAFIFYYLVISIARSSLSTKDFVSFIEDVWTPFKAGLFTVTVNTTAYLTEVLRGGINSVDKGQKEASLALGLNSFQTMIFVVFPQAIKNSLPSIGNEFIINIKDTSVLTMIGILDLFSVASQDILGVFGGKSLEAYLIVAIYYLIMTFLTSKLLQYIEKKMDVPVKEITSSN